MKCMNKEKKRGIRAHTKGLKLGMGWNLGGKEDFLKEKLFGSREKR